MFVRSFQVGCSRRVLDALLERCPEAAKREDQYGLTPLHTAFVDYERKFMNSKGCAEFGIDVLDMFRMMTEALYRHIVSSVEAHTAKARTACAKIALIRLITLKKKKFPEPNSKRSIVELIEEKKKDLPVDLQLYVERIRHAEDYIMSGNDVDQREEEEEEKKGGNNGDDNEYNMRSSTDEERMRNETLNNETIESGEDRDRSAAVSEKKKKQSTDVACSEKKQEGREFGTSLPSLNPLLFGGYVRNVGVDDDDEDLDSDDASCISQVSGVSNHDKTALEESYHFQEDKVDDASCITQASHRSNIGKTGSEESSLCHKIDVDDEESFPFHESNIFDDDKARRDVDRDGKEQEI